jgi:hypothetical protein
MSSKEPLRNHGILQNQLKPSLEIHVQRNKTCFKIFLKIYSRFATIDIKNYLLNNFAIWLIFCCCFDLIDVSFPWFHWIHKCLSYIIICCLLQDESWLEIKGNWMKNQHFFQRISLWKNFRDQLLLRFDQVFLTVISSWIKWYEVCLVAPGCYRVRGESGLNCIKKGILRYFK